MISIRCLFSAFFTIIQYGPEIAMAKEEKFAGQDGKW
jgi:hypothetical protein